VTFLGFLDEYEDVLGHMRAAQVFVSPSTREGFGITYAEAMAADCIVIAAGHPESAAGEVIGEAGYLVEPTVDGVVEVLDSAIAGSAPRRLPPDVQNSTTGIQLPIKLRACIGERLSASEWSL
jgi:glycosyltransferase involved in cell wall biosynthesis